MAIDILIIFAEACFLILTFFSINLLVGVIFKQMHRVSWLREKAEKFANQRRNIRRFLNVTCVLLCLALVAVNGVVAFQGRNVLEFQLNLIANIPTQFWITLVTGTIATAIIVWLIKVSIPYLHRSLDFACEWAKNVDDISGNDRNIELFFNFLKQLFTNSICILALIFSAQLYNLPEVVPENLFLGLKIYITITIGLLLVKALSAFIDTIDTLAVRNSRQDNLLRFYTPLHHLVPLTQKCLEYAIYVGVGILVLREIEPLAWIANYGLVILQIIGISLVTGIATEIANMILDDLVFRATNLTDLQRQRRLTIVPLFKSFLKYFIYFTAGVAVLKLIGIDPTPVLAGAGIIGLAVGFGAQNLVNDIVCGFFILFENYYLVGDYIEVNQASGYVEAIDLRTTRIRHRDGQLHIIRNGEIKDIVNFSKQYIYAVVNVGVAYQSNLDLVYEVLEEVGKQLDEEYDEILEPLRVGGLEDFGEFQLLIKTKTKVKPGRDSDMRRIIRKRIKEAFDREGIEIPYMREFN